MENRLLDAQALGEMIGLQNRTVLNKLCKDPNSLPPAVKVQGFRGPRWRWSDVQTWISALPLSDAVTVTDVPKARLGRRRKTVN